MRFLSGMAWLRWRNMQLTQENKRLQSLVNLLGLKVATLQTQVSGLSGELKGARYVLAALTNGAKRHESSSPASQAENAGNVQL